MARAKKSKARTDRYQLGLTVTDTKTKSGFRIDKSKPRDKDDVLFCKKGEVYYWWKFMNRSKMYSLKAPRPSQLTQSEFYISVYSIQEGLTDMSPTDFVDSPDDLMSYKEGVIGEIQIILEELEEKQINLEQYEGLSQSPVYDLITERVDAIESWINEMESIDVDIDVDSIHDDVESEFDDNCNDNEKEELYIELLKEAISEKIDDMNECCCDI